MEIKLNIYEKGKRFWHDTITEEDIIRWWKEENLKDSEEAEVSIDIVII